MTRHDRSIHDTHDTPTADFATADFATADFPTADIPTADIPTDGTHDTPTADFPTADFPTADFPTDDIPTDDEVVELYRAVARDGLRAHSDRLARLARAAEHVGAEPALVRLLGDRTAPDAIRTRAVARLARQWPTLTATVDAGDTFRELLARWNAHQDLRSSGHVEIAELATSRSRLDRVRLAHRAARRAPAAVG